MDSRYIHSPTNDSGLAFFMAQYCSALFHFHILLKHSSVEGHTGCVPDLAIRKGTLHSWWIYKLAQLCGIQ